MIKKNRSLTVQTNTQRVKYTNFCFNQTITITNIIIIIPYAMRYEKNNFLLFVKFYLFLIMYKKLIPYNFWFYNIFNNIFSINQTLSLSKASNPCLDKASG